MQMRKNRSIERSGVNHVRTIVDASDCTFSEIHLENDYGIDCFIEFFSDLTTTGFCAFAQIKSGKSYKDNQGYKIGAKHEHIVYWSQHVNPIVGIVYDPDIDKAFWINISDYIHSNPKALEGESHVIRVPACNIFSSDFNNFKLSIIRFAEQNKGYENFGRSLEYFATFDVPAKCYDGMKSLYANHRSKDATWYYIVSNFVNIKEDGIRLNILLLISNYIYTGDTFFESGYNEKETERIMELLSKLLTQYFGQEEIYFALYYMRDGVYRGTYSYRLYLVLGLIEGIDNLLENMVFNKTTKDKIRPFIMWLFMFYSQHKSIEYTLSSADRYLDLFPNGDEDGIILGVKQTIIKEGGIRIG